MLISEFVNVVGIFPLVSVFVVVVVCLKFLISLEPNVAGKSFISIIFWIVEEVNPVGIFVKSTFPVVWVVVVMVFCWKLLIVLDPIVSGKSFISTIFLISELVNVVGIFPIVSVFVVVVVCLKLLVSFIGIFSVVLVTVVVVLVCGWCWILICWILDDPKVSGKFFILTISSKLFFVNSSGLISCVIAVV